MMTETGALARGPARGLSLRALLHTAGRPLVQLLTGPADSTRLLVEELAEALLVRSTALVEAEELRERSVPEAEALLVLGVRGGTLAELLDLVPPRRALFLKLGEGFAVEAHAAALAAAAARGIAVVRVHDEAGWDQLSSILQRLLEAPSSRSARPSPGGAEHAPTAVEAPPTGAAVATGATGATGAGAHPEGPARPEPEYSARADGRSGDLFTLAETVAAQLGGLVSIEEVGGEVLAYSRATEGADALRISSILGRRGPAEQMRRLSDEGVMRALAEEGGVLRVPPAPELGRAERIAAGIHSDGVELGAIWVQRGTGALAPDAEALLPGAARLAAGLMRGRVGVTRREDRLVLLGLGIAPSETGEIARPTAAEAYGLASIVNPGPRDAVAVIGFERPRPAAAEHPRGGPPAGATAEVAVYLRLHSASFRRPLALAVAGDRLFGIVATSDTAHVLRWAESALADADRRFAPGMRAAIAEAPGGLAGVETARRAVEHLLDTVTRDHAGRYPRVVSQRGLRSEVLLGELTEFARRTSGLRDPRLDALRTHDREHGGALCESVRAYLDAFSDVRAAALRLGVHPNTLRYRIQRAEALSGADLADAATRIVWGILLRLP